MSTNWTKDSYAELKLDELGLKYTIKTIALSDVDSGTSIENSGRCNEAIVQHVVDDYASAMERGDSFPMLVCYSAGKKWVVVGGNHRMAAMKAVGITEFDAYCVEVKVGWQALMLGKVLNRGHGLRSDRDEALLNAVWCVKNTECKIKDAAIKFGVSCDTLSKELRAREASAMFQSHGIPTVGIQRGNLTRLGSIKNTKVAVEAARIVALNKLDGDACARLVKDISAATGSEAAQISAINDFKEKCGYTSGRNTVTVATPRDSAKSLLPALTKLEKAVTGKFKLSDFGLNDADVKEKTIKRLQALGSKLHAIAK